MFLNARSMRNFLNMPDGGVAALRRPQRGIWVGYPRSPRTPIPGLYLASSFGGSGGFTGAMMSGAAAAWTAMREVALLNNPSRAARCSRAPPADASMRTPSPVRLTMRPLGRTQVAIWTPLAEPPRNLCVKLRSTSCASPEWQLGAKSIFPISLSRSTLFPRSCMKRPREEVAFYWSILTIQRSPMRCALLFRFPFASIAGCGRFCRWPHPNSRLQRARGRRGIASRRRAHIAT
jgi:hypothetical protein